MKNLLFLLFVLLLGCDVKEINYYTDKKDLLFNCEKIRELEKKTSFSVVTTTISRCENKELLCYSEIVFVQNFFFPSVSGTNSCFVKDKK